MAYSKPARTTARRAQATVYGRRRRGALIGAVLVLLLAHVAFAGNSGSRSAAGRHPHPLGGNGRTLSNDQAYSSSVTWPQRGQAALLLGNNRPKASPDEQPVPIASVTEVMTAYLVLNHYPLSGAQDGFTVTITPAQAEEEAQDQSVAAVAVGEQLTERQLLEALLIPSGNNIAEILATQIADSEIRFVAEMNAEARALEMDRTTYTDPSGWHTGTVSTAAGQLRVFEQATRLPVFRQIVSMASVSLPVAGTPTNTKPLIAQRCAGKTGSDSAARGCLAFFTSVTVDGRSLTAVGVVLGQGRDTSVTLATAGQAATQLVEAVAPATGISTIPAPSAIGRPLLLAPARAPAQS